MSKNSNPSERLACTEMFYLPRANAEGSIPSSAPNYKEEERQDMKEKEMRIRSLEIVISSGVHTYKKAKKESKQAKQDAMKGF